jgi:hypothetical protein
LIDEVECTASASYPGDPRAVYWEGSRLEIERTHAQWRMPGRICFRVEIKDGRIFEMYYEEDTQRWYVETL